MRELVNLLQSIGDIPETEIKRFVALCSRTAVAKDAYFIREGYRTSRLGFVEKGLFRSLYLTEDGAECTFSFSAEKTFLYECQAMRTLDVAHYSVQALEDSTIVEIDYKLWAKPFEDSAWWNKILLDLTASELSEKQIREVELMQLSGRDRYTHFLEKYGDLECRIKQHVIASYLGVTPVTLSRVRKEMGLIASI